MTLSRPGLLQRLFPLECVLPHRRVVSSNRSRVGVTAKSRSKICAARPPTWESPAWIWWHPKDWPVLRKYGITPCMVQGAGTFKDGWNDKAVHDTLEEQARASIVRAADGQGSECDYVVWHPARENRAGRHRQLHHGPESREEIRRGSTASPCASSCSTAKWITRTIRATTPASAWPW